MRRNNLTSTHRFLLQAQFASYGVAVAIEPCSGSGICPVEAALERIGGKWKGIALYHLLDGPLRYNELRRQAEKVAQRMLSKQLRELENDGLIVREIFPVVPPHVEYNLTDEGRTLKPILLALRKWGESYV